jgi:hypothetical protein
MLRKAKPLLSQRFNILHALCALVGAFAGYSVDQGFRQDEKRRR